MLLELYIESNLELQFVAKRKGEAIQQYAPVLVVLVQLCRFQTQFSLLELRRIWVHVIYLVPL